MRPRSRFRFYSGLLFFFPFQRFQFYSGGFNSIEGILDQFCKGYYRICARGPGLIPRIILHAKHKLISSRPSDYN